MCGGVCMCLPMSVCVSEHNMVTIFGLLQYSLASSGHQRMLRVSAT